MWILYYLNEKRVADISYQIKPELISEEKRIRKRNLHGKIKGTLGLSSLFSKITKIDAEAEVDGNHASDTEQTIQYPELDQKTRNALDYFAKQKNYVLIGDEAKVKKLKPNVLIRYSGMFHPHIKGDTYSERLGNYEGAKNICWSGKCGDYHIKFFTGKSSLISNTPIHPAIETKQGKIFLEGYGLYSKQSNNRIIITPILFGTQIAK